MRHRCVIMAVLLSIAAGTARAQSGPASQNQAQDQPQPAAPTPTLTTQSTLVLVPALVHDKSGQLVFNLKAEDFALTDDGVPQRLRLEKDSGGEPLALVVDIEGGGEAASKIDRFAPLISMLDAIAGGVPHKIAVVGFDSSPVVVTDFTSNNDAAERGIKDLLQDNNGDDGAAILDSLTFSLDLLRKQPPEYRRAILLVSETHDDGSHIAIDDAMRNLSDSNTTIYAVAFSSTRSKVNREAPKTFGEGPIPWLSSKDPVPPGPAHGCFSRNPNDPQVDLGQSRAQQDYDCLSTLAPPLRLAKLAYMAVRGSLQQNIPETSAHLTGGEYFTLGNQRQFERDLLAISNHIPNRYMLSFQPQSPHVGFHALKLSAPNYAHLEVSGRAGYWAEPAGQSSAPPPPAPAQPAPAQQ